MYLYLDEDGSEDNPEIESGDVELLLTASEEIGGQTGYLMYRLDGGLKGDALTTGQSTAGVKGRWGDLSIGTTTDLTSWGRYGNDDIFEFDPGHTFENGSLGFVRQLGSLKLGLGYTPAANASNQAAMAGQDAIFGMGLEIATGQYTIGLNTQDQQTTVGIKGLFGRYAYGLHYIDVDDQADEIIGFKLDAKSGDLEMTLSYNVQGDKDKTRLDLAFPIAGAFTGEARFQDDYSRLGMSMEF